MTTSAAKKALGTRLRLARETAGLSQHEVARRLRLHRPSVSETEAGRRNLSALELAQFAKLYSVPMEWLASGKECALPPDGSAQVALEAIRALPEVEEALKAKPALLLPAEVLEGVRAALRALKARAGEAEANLHALSEGSAAEALQRAGDRERLVRTLHETQARFQTLAEVVRRAAGAIRHFLRPTGAGNLEAARPAFEAISLMLYPPEGAMEPGRWFAVAELEWIGQEVLRAFQGALRASGVPASVAAPAVSALVEHLRGALEIRLLGFATPIPGGGSMPTAWADVEEALVAMERALAAKEEQSPYEKHMELRASAERLRTAAGSLKLLWRGLGACAPEAVARLHVGPGLGLAAEDVAAMVSRILTHLQAATMGVSPGGQSEH